MILKKILLFVLISLNSVYANTPMTELVDLSIDDQQLLMAQKDQAYVHIPSYIRNSLSAVAQKSNFGMYSEQL